MPAIIIMMGIQGSGKSTFCAKIFPEYTRINLDTLRTRKKEMDALWQAIKRKENIIIDNTNPTVSDRKKYIEAGKAYQYEIIGCFMQSKLEECIERNNSRIGKEKIPSIAITCTSNKLEMPSYEEGFVKLYFVKITDTGYSVSEWRA